jgi:hypothetical protein
MSVRVRTLTERQYTDTMLVTIGADHVASAAGGDALLLLAIPALWIVGVIVFVAFKFHSR